MSSSLKESALNYAELGLMVFPCRPGQKTPATRDGFKSATTDPSQIHKWWTSNPSYNIGIATGKVSGIVVVDLDIKNGVSGIDSFSEFEAQRDESILVPTVTTPSGGVHLWFAAPEGESVRNHTGVLPCVDIRGCGGYVIAPPSLVDGSPYAWKHRLGDSELGTFPRDLIPEKTPQRSNPEASGTHNTYSINKGEFHPYVRRAIERECENVRRAEPGTRNDTLNRAAYNLGQLVGGGYTFGTIVTNHLLACAYECGLDSQEATATIDSGVSAGRANPRTIPESGYPVPPPTSSVPLRVLSPLTGGEPVVDVDVTHSQSDPGGSGSGSGTEPLESLHISNQWIGFEGELVARADGGFEPVPGPIDGLNEMMGGGAHRAAVTLLCGAPGSGKTSLAIEWGGMWARDEGHSTLFWSLEMPSIDVMSRMVCLERGLNWGDVRAGKHIEESVAVGKKIRGANLYLADRDIINDISSLICAFNRICDKHGTAPLMIIDYAQLIAVAKNDADIRTAAAQSSYALLQMARKHAACVIALSSVSRAAYKILDSENRPQVDMVLRMAKESGQFEFDAANVCGISLLPDTGRGKRLGWITVAKSRLGGRTGSVAVKFDGRSGKFYDADEGEIPTHAADIDVVMGRVPEVLDRHGPQSKRKLRTMLGCSAKKSSDAIDLALEKGLIRHEDGKYTV